VDLPINHSVPQLEQLASLWGLKFVSVKDEYIPAGSPERTLERFVFEDKNGDLFLLERIASRDLIRKNKIIHLLRDLSSAGMPYILEYRTALDGTAIVEFDNDFWQLSPYIKGVQLDRLRYMYEGWRAESISRFILELNKKTEELTLCDDEVPFSLKKYIYELTGKVAKHRPDIIGDVNDVVGYLEKEFMDAYGTIPVGFCHGDYHPLNIIWSEKDILAVIDWEFMGMKPYIYDIANMVGCLGMEHPSSLKGDLICGFLDRLRSDKRFSPGMEWLVDFTIALRFAWLSEWLRKNDEVMVGMELDYMYLLINEREDLRLKWML
jgi:homoserine kinase type II